MREYNKIKYIIIPSLKGIKRQFKITMTANENITLTNNTIHRNNNKVKNRIGLHKITVGEMFRYKSYK